jgi:hypothetical protein
VLLAADLATTARTVNEISVALGVGRSTLWKAWRDSTGQRGRFEDLVDWLLLVKAMAAHAEAGGWLHAASRVAVHEHTLMRIARRLVGVSLLDLTRTAGTLFADSAIVPILSRFLSPSAVNNIFLPGNSHCPHEPMARDWSLAHDTFGSSTGIA